MRLGEIMKNLIFKGLIVLLFIFAFQTAVEAAPACKGPNKYDLGCPDAAAPDPEPDPEPDPIVDPVVVDSVTVDWLNEKLVVRGSGFTVSTSFLLGSSATPLSTAGVTDTELDIPFSAVMQDEVPSQGNYKLDVDGTVQLSIFIESQVIDAAATGCPCAADWATELGALWDPLERVTACYEISQPGAADISGTILSVPWDGTSYPIGAAYYGDDPDSSVCRLVEVDETAAVVDLVNVRINAGQQAECAWEIENKVCDTVTPVSFP